MAELFPTILKFPFHVLIHIIIRSASKSGRKTSKQRPNRKTNSVSRAPTRVTLALEGLYAHILRARAHALLPEQTRVRGTGSGGSRATRVGGAGSGRRDLRA